MALVLASGRGEGLDDGDVAGGGAIEERAAEREGLHLAVDLLGVVARLRAEHDATTAPQGERMEPARARPVPFWRHGFLPPPRTSPRVLVECVPWRLLALMRDDDFLDGLEALVAFERRETVEILFAARRAIGSKNGKFHDWSVSPG